MKIAAWGLALAAIPWSLATNAFGYDAERLAATSLPAGIEVYVLRDAVRGCHADIDVRIQLDAESAIPMDQVHRLLPRIGAAAAEHCPVAVAARLDVVRSDRPNIPVDRLTALKARDWVAERQPPENPLVAMYEARAGWEAHCTNRVSLFDKARREPSNAPRWLRGAWDRTGQWVASSRQWVGNTAAAFSSGQWPGEFRARVADFEAAGGGLCILVRQELDHAGAALGAGRLQDAARYIARANDLLPRAQAAYDAAEEYFRGAVDRAEAHWDTVFKASKVAFSATLAVGTGGGSLAPSVAGYYTAKYGLLNALEFWADSKEMPLKDAAAKRAQILAMEVLIDGLLGDLVPSDFIHERLAAQGQLATADALLANASADLLQELPAALDPERLRQVAEQAMAQTTDAAVRNAIEQMVQKGGEYFLAQALDEGRDIIRGIGLIFGPEYLARRGTPEAGSAIVVPHVPCPEQTGGQSDLPVLEHGDRGTPALSLPGEDCHRSLTETGRVVGPGLVSSVARADTEWDFDAPTAILLYPGESQSGVAFGPDGGISVESVTLFPERAAGLSSFDFLYVKVYETGEGARIVELFEVVAGGAETDDALLATAVISPEGDILYQRVFPGRSDGPDAGCEQAREGRSGESGRPARETAAEKAAGAQG